MVQAISKRQFCSLLSFNQLWNAQSPFLVAHPYLFSFWADRLPQDEQIVLMQSVLSGLVAISVKDEIEISEEVFRQLVVFYKLMLHVPPKMMVDAKPLKRLLLKTIRSERTVHRMVGYHIIKFMTTLLNEKRVEDYLSPLSIQERLILSRVHL
ncbi:uncharacterized protein [Blastocystis hominis]|uniref:Uncharacterized protein n=1 Tax=Blastocystis hominis TaxID=12968 RepID=D8LZ46_BLAHO|nr:uncharacterized protein [Blastocystis hominis]CBK21085.2 unnamed protein product [Blastocystis hominis]|eukprot:XP_012895133.1 uncharacterized protein [Blastocystis hominis]